LIKEAAPPSDLGKMEATVNLKSNQWNQRAQARKDAHLNNYVQTQKQMTSNKFC